MCWERNAHRDLLAFARRAFRYGPYELTALDSAMAFACRAFRCGLYEVTRWELATASPFQHEDQPAQDSVTVSERRGASPASCALRVGRAH